MQKNGRKELPAYMIRIPIAPGRGGLIRYMDYKTALERPRELFMYDVLTLLIVESGKATYIADNVFIELSPRSVVWFFPRQKRTLYHRTRDFKMWVIEFTSDFLQATCTEQHDAILKKRKEKEFYRLIPSQEFKLMRRILHEILNLGEKGSESVLGNEGENDLFNAGLHYILQHCWYIFRTTKNEPCHEEIHPAISKAICLICGEDSDNISISQLAQQCGISASRIVPLFRKEVGVTITEFRNRQKLDRFFIHYSPNGPHTLMSAAFDAGFGSYAQFYRVFRQFIGVSPKEYFG